MEIRTLKVEGMSCDHCRMAVTRALQGVAGVSRADVSLADETATVSYDAGRVTLAVLAAAVEEAGYNLVVD